MPSPPRRLTRGAHPSGKPAPPASTASSSSLSSARQDRNPKSHTTQKSATPRSLSSEDTSEPPRRSARSHQLKEEETNKDAQEVDDEAGDEEEITRCICGQQEYPGPPLSEAFSEADAQSEDAGGLFISCDGCSVWQHGGCVGIVEESQVPDKYFCEECRPKLHELHTDSKGQKYSLYQPVYATKRRTSSMSKHGDKAQKERENTESRASADPVTGRRRGTMRSKEHDDEEEQIARAIEESRRDVDSNGPGRRNGKRARDDSDDNKLGIKRQRRVSETAGLNARTASLDDESDDEPATANISKAKKARADAVQSVREAELRQKEKERERARNEAAGRRQERAGRRRADDELIEDTPKPSTSAKTSPPPSSQPTSPAANAGPEKISHKKGAGKKTKKLGNNQYTKLKGGESNGTLSSPYGKKRQPANNSASSGDEQQMTNGDNITSHSSHNNTSKNSPDHTVPTTKGKFGKGKGKGINGTSAKHALEEPAELTLPKMKRWMEAMAADIARAQLEMAGDRTPSSTSGPRDVIENTSFGSLAGGAVRAPAPTAAPAVSSNGLPYENQNLSAMEMADDVSRRIAHWSSLFGQRA